MEDEWKLAEEQLEPIYNAIVEDEILTPQQVRDIWRDEFLTNVIVPFLEHIRENVRAREASFLRDISERGHGATHQEVASFQALLDEANALKATIEILREWRG